MKSRITADFRKAYRSLPEEIRRQARRAYELFKDDHITLAYVSNPFTRPSRYIQFALAEAIER